MARTFSGTVSNWAKQNEARLTAVFRDACQQVANDVRVPISEGGHMPVLTGNLRRSLTASTTEMPQTRDSTTKYDRDVQGNVILTIAKAKLDDTIYLGFQANYAPIQEQKHKFVALTAQRWPQILRASAAKIRKAMR